MINDPLEIIKRLDVKQNVTIRVIDEPTGKVVQEHVGHNAATNSLLTGIAHYLMGDGVLNQGADTLSTWIPQYISLGTMGLSDQETEVITDSDAHQYKVPRSLGDTPVAPSGATEREADLNAELRFTEYLNQTPGFGADGYDANSNNNRRWFGLGFPYSLKPDCRMQYFGNAGETEYTLDPPVLAGSKDNILSVTIYPPTEAHPAGEINQNEHDTSVTRMVLSVNDYDLDDTGTVLRIDNGSQYSGRIAIMYFVESTDAANCELIQAKYDNQGNIVSTTLRSKITYRNMVPEYQSEVPNTLDVILSAYVSTGALAAFRGDRDYIYITEAGLWSGSRYSNSGDNGLLAAYRIMPTDDDIPSIRTSDTFTGDGTETTFELSEVIEDIISVTVGGKEVDAYTYDKNAGTITFSDAPKEDDQILVEYFTVDVTDTWKDMSIEANRQRVQKSIIRIGVNQVAQIVWKIQLGGLEQLNGLRYLYPSQYPDEVWEIYHAV